MTRRDRILSTSCLTIVAASLAVSGAWAQVLPNPMDFGKAYEQLAFEAADTNDDNLVSEAEFVRDAAAAFSGLDRDRDDKLTPDKLGPHDARSFAKVDADGDGYLTFREVMKFKMTAFRSADKNGDGALSFDEMVSSVAAEVGSK